VRENSPHRSSRSARAKTENRGKGVLGETFCRDASLERSSETPDTGRRKYVASDVLYRGRGLRMKLTESSISARRSRTRRARTVRAEKRRNRDQKEPSREVKSQAYLAPLPPGIHSKTGNRKREGSGQVSDRRRTRRV